MLKKVQGVEESLTGDKALERLVQKNSSQRGIVHLLEVLLCPCGSPQSKHVDGRGQSRRGFYTAWAGCCHLADLVRLLLLLLATSHIKSTCHVCPLLAWLTTLAASLSHAYAQG